MIGFRKKTLLYLFTSLILISCNEPNSKQSAKYEKKFNLSIPQAKSIIDMPVHCLTVEYPNKLGQSLGSDSDLKSPHTLHPIFYGCYDWHSSVHGYWSIVKLLKTYPTLDADGKIKAILKKHITSENVKTEMRIFNDKNNLAFERPYGWAWLFKLQEELITWNDDDAKLWAASLQPLVNLLSERLKTYLPKLVYPIRHGKHENTAFALSLILDYTKAANDVDLKHVIIENTSRLYGNDSNCDMAYEPSGSDFLSPCLEEAYLMSKVLNQTDYKNWLKSFLPAIFEKKYSLEPGIVKDRSDGQLVHLDGLNYSRAACLYGISLKLPELNYLRAIADNHISYALKNLSKEDDYMGSHWLGTFALYALTHQ